jgi:RNA polymerase sigma-70 factor (ECF subfamily)
MARFDPAAGVPFRNWLFNHLHSRRMDRGRMLQSRKRRDPLDLALRSSPAGDEDQPALVGEAVADTRADQPGSGLEAADLRALLTQALRTLPAEEREAFVLHFVEGVVLREVAGRLGLTLGTARNRALSGAARLRDYLATHHALTFADLVPEPEKKTEP